MNLSKTLTLQSLAAAAALAFTLNVHAATTNDTATASDASSSSQTVGEHVDDAALTTKVKTKLLAAHDVTSTHIHVKSRNNVVWLRGSVPTADEKSRVTDVVRSVDGVSTVHNRLRVNAHPDKTWLNHKKAQAHNSMNDNNSTTDTTNDTYEKH